MATDIQIFIRKPKQKLNKKEKNIQKGENTQ